MLELAGEIADGVLLNWIPPEAVPASIAQLEAGARRAAAARSGASRSPHSSAPASPTTRRGARARRWRATSPATPRWTSTRRSFRTLPASPTKCPRWTRVERGRPRWRREARCRRACSTASAWWATRRFCRARIAEFARTGLTQPVIVRPSPRRRSRSGPDAPAHAARGFPEPMALSVLGVIPARLASTRLPAQGACARSPAARSIGLGAARRPGARPTSTDCPGRDGRRGGRTP